MIHKLKKVTFPRCLCSLAYSCVHGNDDEHSHEGLLSLHSKQLIYLSDNYITAWLGDLRCHAYMHSFSQTNSVVAVWIWWLWGTWSGAVFQTVTYRERQLCVGVSIQSLLALLLTTWSSLWPSLSHTVLNMSAALAACFRLHETISLFLAIM